MYIFTGAELRLPFIHHMYETEMLSSTSWLQVQTVLGRRGGDGDTGGFAATPNRGHKSQP